MDEITIDSTVNEDYAMVEYLDSTDTEIADADSGKAGWQVSLTEGANTIKVKVTAEDTTTNTYTVVVTRNTAPTGADKTVTIGSDTAHTFEAEDFGFVDTDTADMLASVRIESVPGAGELALNGTAAVVDQVVTRVDIDDDKLTFTPVTGGSGDNYANFNFKVNDGTDFSVSANTITFNVTDLSCAAPSFGARRQLWTGIVTVGDIENAGYGFRSDLSQTGLDDTTFAIGRNSYTVDTAFVLSSTGQLSFGVAGDIQNNNLTAGEVAALRLHVCDTVFYDFSAATLLGNENTYRWAGSLDWSPPVATRTLYLSLPANHDAMGAPTITGTAQVGQDLTADVTGVTDADGLTGDFSTIFDNMYLEGVQYSYQWLRVDDDGTSNETEITGEIASTYTLTDADVGKKVKVKVSFTDDLNGVEERTSAAFPSTDTVSANNAPVFNPSNVSRNIAENTAAGQNVGAVVEATDADAGDTLTYTLGGTDMASFDFVASTGQIRTKSGITYDHEATPSYTVTVTATDSSNATADATVTISVTDVDEPPDAPATPAVNAVSGSTTSLAVSWAAPANAGKPDIDSYDVQYRVTGATAWSDGPQNVTGTSTTATITSLAANTPYEVQVRATNDEGDSGWSAPPGAGRTNAPANNAPVFSPSNVSLAASPRTLPRARTSAPW